MAKDILLFGKIDEYNAMFFMAQMDEATEKDAEVEFLARINCEGGSPDYAMSIIETIQENQEKFAIKGGAQLHSMALFMLCYVPVEKCECIDTTQALLHRAAWPEWLEEMPSFEGSIYQQSRDKSNKDLEKAFRARVDVASLEALPQFIEKNITLKDIFSTDGRIEVLLTGSDLKKIGLVSKVNKITPTKAAVMAAQTEEFKKCKSLDDFRLAAQHMPKIAAEKETEKETKKPKVTVMTLKELKATYPAVYAQAKADGHAEGVAAEKDRVESILVFNELDPVGVKAAIEAGKPLTAKQQSEFAMKSFSKDALAKLKAESAKDLTTEEVDEEEGTPKDEKAKKVAEFEKGVVKTLKLKKAV